jgi:acylphosphatase
MKKYFIVHGFVQGVGYRYLVRRIALRYDLKGFARNLRDGSVEILVDGEKDSIEKFEVEINVDLQHGPQVHNMERFSEKDPGFPNDDKKYDDFKVFKD